MNTRKDIPILGKCPTTPNFAPERQADIPAAIDELERNINHLNEVVQNLWGRLDNVLRQEHCEEKCQNVGIGGECHISLSIRKEAQRIQDLVISVERMQDLLEV